ncbi:MAG: hypothetical protein IT379_06125, partial [Deltaproteobacteria bacterium]|nr:hypothetical protein [Deltaproteobacteria bacterium]
TMCVTSGMVNPTNPCQECNPAMSTTAWSNRSGSCEDGDYCTVGETCSGGTCGGSTTRDCDDSIACTTDTCNETANRCDNPIANGQCLIGGTCYANNDPNPAEQCQECRTSMSQSSWSNRSGSCDDGMACTTGDMCMSGMCMGGTSSCDGGT